MTTRADFYQAVRENFSNQPTVSRAELVDFYNSTTGLRHFSCLTTNADLRVRHGQFRVPTQDDIDAVALIDSQKTNRGRKPGVKYGSYKKGNVSVTSDSNTETSSVETDASSNEEVSEDEPSLETSETSGEFVETNDVTAKPVGELGPVTDEMMKVKVRNSRGHFMNAEEKLNYYLEQGYSKPE